jgi:hypothetical protein
LADGVLNIEFSGGGFGLFFGFCMPGYSSGQGISGDT